MTRRLLTIALLAALAGCGSQSSGGAPATARSDRLVDFDQPAPFVNALDLDPRDGALLLTTNLGFWRIDPEKDTVERVRGKIAAKRQGVHGRHVPRAQGDRDGELIGSGHPDDPGTLPNFLGLIPPTTPAGRGG